MVPSLYISNNDVQEIFSYGNYILAWLILERVSEKQPSQYDLGRKVSRGQTTFGKFIMAEPTVGRTAFGTDIFGRSSSISPDS